MADAHVVAAEFHAAIAPAKLRDTEANGFALRAWLETNLRELNVENLKVGANALIEHLDWEVAPQKLVRIQEQKRKDNLAALGLSKDEPTQGAKLVKTEGNRNVFEADAVPTSKRLTAQQESDAAKAAKNATAERASIDQLASSYQATRQGRIDYSRTDTGRAKIKACRTYAEAKAVYESLP